MYWKSRPIQNLTLKYVCHGNIINYNLYYFIVNKNKYKIFFFKLFSLLNYLNVLPVAFLKFDNYEQCSTQVRPSG